MSAFRRLPFPVLRTDTSCSGDRGREARLPHPVEEALERRRDRLEAERRLEDAIRAAGPEADDRDHVTPPREVEEARAAGDEERLLDHGHVGPSLTEAVEES